MTHPDGDRYFYNRVHNQSRWNLTEEERTLLLVGAGLKLMITLTSSSPMGRAVGPACLTPAGANCLSACGQSAVARASRLRI